MSAECNDTLRTEIASWITGLLQGSGLGSFDDLHVDDIHRDFQRRETWADAMRICLHIAEGITRLLGANATVVIGASLTADPDGEDLAPESLEALVTQTDWTPPSLYLFHLGQEPWRADGISATMKSLVDGSRIFTLYICTWYDAHEQESRRVAWLVSARDNPLGAGLDNG